MKLFIFDCETTGLNYWQHGIHQIAGIIEIDGKVVETFDIKCRPNPKAKIDQGALDAGHVTLEQIMAYPPMEEGYRRLIAILSQYVDKFNKTDKFFTVGFNNSAFDGPFLRAFFKQNGDVYFGSWFWSAAIDVMCKASDQLKEDRPKMENFKLMTVAKWLGVEVDEAKLHDASYDVDITRDAYYKLEERIHGKRGAGGVAGEEKCHGCNRVMDAMETNYGTPEIFCCLQCSEEAAAASDMFRIPYKTGNQE